MRPESGFVRSGRLLRIPLLACLVTLLLYVGLISAMAGNGPLARFGSQALYLSNSGHAHAAPPADEGNGDNVDNGGNHNNAGSNSNDIVDSSNGGSGDGKGNKKEKWEGAVITYPSTLLGIWTIRIEDGSELTVTVDAATRFHPSTRDGIQVEDWVEVKGVQQPGGGILAERIRKEEYEAGEIVVRLADPSVAATIAEKYDLQLKSNLLISANIYLFVTDDEDEPNVIERIKSEPGVIWAEVNYVNSMPEDDGYKTWAWGGVLQPPDYVNQMAYQQIRWGQTSRSYQGEGVVVAVLDTGIYTPHEQFVGKLQLPSLDVVGDDMDPSDVGPGAAWGHGTHVAGIIAAMAPAAKLLPVRVLDANGRGNTFLLSYAIEWASQQPGVEVINLSLGTPYDSRILREVIANVLAQDIVVVAAAGNDGVQTVQFPAGYPEVVGVTALDGNNQKPEFANYGNGWIDLAAPGVGIMSTMISDQGVGYASWSGTSMATAFVSAAAVLVEGQALALGSPNEPVGGHLFNTGVIVDSLNPTYAGQLGRLLNVSAALSVHEMILYIPYSRR